MKEKVATWELTTLNMFLSCINLLTLNLKAMKKSNLRMVAVLGIGNTITTNFSEVTDTSHRNLYNEAMAEESFDRDYDIPVYGRFYSLLYGNSRNPQLIIYGESSDYRLENLGHHQDNYEKAIRSMVSGKGWDLLFLP